MQKKKKDNCFICVLTYEFLQSQNMDYGIQVAHLTALLVPRI
jgi:hypothetical protein